jgi:hypothetical protein
MDEMFRMLGREHEADLEREALKWERAAPFRASRKVAAEVVRPSRLHRLASARVAFFGRLARDPR